MRAAASGNNSYLDYYIALEDEREEYEEMFNQYDDMLVKYYGVSRGENILLSVSW